MTSIMTNLLRLTSLLFLVFGCDSTPQPMPVPAPNRLFIRYSTPVSSVEDPSSDQNRDILIIGLPGSVEGAGKVHIMDQKTSKETIINATPEGSFSGVVITDAVTDLSIAFENNDGLSPAISFGWLQLGITPRIVSNRTNSHSLVVSAPDHQG